MGIELAVRRCVRKFEAENPTCLRKVKFTSGERTPLEQLKIVLSPRNAANYPNIKKAFLEQFELDKLPSFTEVSGNPQQLKWWISSIKAQAGKAGGFAHVGGNAQDVDVTSLDPDERMALEILLANQGFRVLYERVIGNTSKFKGVTIGQATTFHVYKGPQVRLIA